MHAQTQISSRTERTSSPSRSRARAISMARLKSRFFTSFPETKEEEEKEERARGRTEKMEEGVDAPFHRHAQNSPAAVAYVHARIRTHGFVLHYMYIYATSMKYVQGVSLCRLPVNTL